MEYIRERLCCPDCGGSGKRRIVTIEALFEAPHFADLTGRDGLPCRVWRNPSRREFAAALRSRATDASGLRGLVTQTDLYVWQSINLLHPDFERDTAINGIRIALRPDQIMVNDEAVMVEHFPWVFPNQKQAEEMDTEDRRNVVADHLKRHPRLSRVYPNGFVVSWYS